MCNISKANKKQEAIKRMTALELFKPCVKAFTKYDEVQLSEPTGGLYEFNDNEELNAEVEAFEDKHNALVYHVIHTPLRIDGTPMDLYNFLYVSDEEEEWDMDRTDIEDGYVMAYVWNKTDDWMSEFGSIAVKERFGGLVRVS